MANEVNIIIRAEDQASSVLGAVGNSMGGLANIAQNALGSALGFLAAQAVPQVIGAFTNAMGAAGDWAKTLDDMGDVLGTSVKDNAGIAVAVKSVGGNVQALTGNLAFMARGLKDAEGNLGPTGKALDALGVSFLDANGNILPTTEILQNAADKISAMPDGLEKSSALMDIFGRSGKELGDTMNALANDGLANATQKAQDFGLVLSDEAMKQSVEMGKQWEELKMAGMGMAVAFGTEMFPIIIQGIKELTPWVEEMSKQFVAFVQSDEFQSWVQQAIATIQELGAWLGVNLPPVIAALSQFFTTVLVPALTTIWEFLSVNIFPVLQVLWDWLSVNLPPAIQALADFWTTVLWPALNTVWTFLSENIFPLFMAIADFMGAVLGKELQALAGLWQNVLYPVLAVTILPILEALFDWLGKVTGGLDGIGSAIQGVIDWFGSMADAINGLQLPDWLTPGSPTPFENGLRGIADAMNSLSTLAMPQMTASMAVLGAAPQQALNNNYNLTINSNARAEDMAGNFALMKALAS